MPYLQVRDFPPELYGRLKQRAKNEHRSVSQQTIIAINEHVASASARAKTETTVTTGAEERIEKRQRLFARIKATPKPGELPSSDSIVELIHSGRESR